LGHKQTYIHFGTYSLKYRNKQTLDINIHALRNMKKHTYFGTYTDMKNFGTLKTYVLWDIYRNTLWDLNVHTL